MFPELWVQENLEIFLFFKKYFVYLFGKDMSLIPGLGRSPGGGNGNPLQYSCLENPTDWGAWLTTVNGVAVSQTQVGD